MNKLLVLLLLISFEGCQTESYSGDKKVQLLSSKNKFMFGDGDLADKYYSNDKKFIEKHFKTVYSGDTLIATTIKEVNGCGEPFGKISVRNDSIFLQTDDKSNYACTSVEFHQFTYIIKLKGSKKYSIISEP